MENLKLKYCFILFYAVFLTSAAAAEIEVATIDWKPYSGRDLTNYGFTSEIVSKAFERSGLGVKFTFLPWKRARQETEMGKIDVLSPAYFSAERAQIYAVSEPYAWSTLVFCKKKGKDITYKELKDLKPYKIGVVMGYVNSPEFDRADYLQKDSAPSDLLNLKKLLGGRVDLIVIDKFAAVDLLAHNPKLKTTPDDIVFLDPPVAVHPIHILISKKTPDFARKMEAFNSGLQEITKDGTVEKILKKHGLSVDK
ncbi:MAG: transporter substrate-binding domain-containing protein [Gemmatimonadetes bacterium]|jgi:polar amino acid transport system substrate-binding protein|nr:transporter substrate-binding domain-containing protein [Gemmatimonadota bacterium]